jgi:hypothetical protein
MPWISSSVRNKPLAVSAIAVLALVLLAVVHLVTDALQYNAAWWVGHSYEVLESSKAISEQVRDTRLDELALLATAERRPEALLVERKARLGATLARLRDQVKDQQPQVARVDRMSALAKAWAD